MGEIESRFMSFAEWLKSSRKLKNDTYLCTTLGIARSTFAGVKINKSGVGTQTIAAVATNHPQLNVDWLITGRGKMLDGKKVLINTSEGIREYVPNPYTPELAPDDPELYNTFRGADEYIKRLEQSEQQVHVSLAEKSTLSTQVAVWKEKYYDILEKYNACLERERVDK